MTQQMELGGELVPPSQPDVAGRSRLESVVRWLVVIGFPLSLTSPGATVSMALVALYGLVLLAREGGLADDLRRVHRYMLACYLLVVGVDLLNGGGLVNLYTTAVNYLPLLALAPYAYVVRRLGIRVETFDRALQVTLLLAFATSLFGFFVLGIPRPGGLNLAPIGYGIVVAIWTVFLFSRALEQQGRATLSFAAVAAGFVAVLMTESKIDIACLIVGCLVVALVWARQHGRWREMIVGMAGASVLVGIGIYFTAYLRIMSLGRELRLFFTEGTLIVGSFGTRFEQILDGWRTFMERPLLGHGFAERMDAIHRHADPSGPDLSALAYVHNDYFTHLVSYGIFGAVFLVAYFVLTFLLIRKSADAAYRRAAGALLLVLITYAVADVVFNMDPLTGAVTIALGVTLAAVPVRAQAVIDGKSTNDG